MTTHDTPRRVAALVERISRLAQGLYRSEGLPPAQWEALRFLTQANRFSATPTALGLYLGATKGTVSQTIIALARKGLVRKERNREDRRSVSLRPTARGLALLARDPLAEIAAAVAALPPHDRTALGTGLSALLAELLARRGGRAFGQCMNCRFFQRHAAAATADGPHRCGLLGAPLSDADAEKICVEYQRAA